MHVVAACGPVLFSESKPYSLFYFIFFYMFILLYSQSVSNVVHSLQDIKNAQNLVELLQDMVLALNPRDRMVCISPWKILCVNIFLYRKQDTGLIFLDAITKRSLVIILLGRNEK